MKYVSVYLLVIDFGILPEVLPMVAEVLKLVHLAVTGERFLYSS
jgi:hypothetical protein